MKTKTLLLIAALSLTLNSQKLFAMAHGKPAPEPLAPTTNLQEGDLIFIQSQTSQSAALLEATGSTWTHTGILIKKNSQWYVEEAVGPLVATALDTFIGRSRNKAYRILRFKYYDSSMRNAMIADFPKYNKPYDIYFEWSDDRIYCSEFTYKVFKDITGHDLGTLQKMGDMNLSGPLVQAMIKKRYTDQGKTLDLNEPIITPISELSDPDLTLIQSSN